MICNKFPNSDHSHC